MGKVKQYFEDLRQIEMVRQCFEDLKQAACEAEEIYTIDELEEYAEEQRQLTSKKEKDNGNEITGSHSRQG